MTICTRLDPKRTLGWCTGKSIEEPTSDCFKKANIHPHYPHPRSCIGTFNDLPGFAHCIRIKASQMPQQVRAGNVVAGITGLDQVIDAGLLDSVSIIASLAYSKATNGGTRGVLFCRKEDAYSLDELRKMRGNRIISEYQEVMKKFVAMNNIEAEVVPCTGGAEAYVASGQYPLGAALAETGTSLRINDLVEVATIFESQTVLIANTAMYAELDVRESVDFLARLLAGVIEARDKRYLTMNVHKEKVDGIVTILPSSESPNLQRLANGNFAVSSVVPLKGLAALKLRLIKSGATDIVELDAHSII